MDYNFKTNKDDFKNEDFKNDVIILEKSEAYIWELHKLNNIIELFSEIKKRNLKAKELFSLYEGINLKLKKIEKEIINKFPEIESVNFKNHFNKINSLFNEIIKIVEFQKDELNLSENLLDYNKRTDILNGVKKFDYESQFTSTIKEIINILNSENFSNTDEMENIEDKLIINQRNEIKENEKTKEFKEIEEKEIKKEEIIENKEENIYNKIELKNEFKENIVENTPKEVKKDELKLIEPKEENKDINNEINILKEKIKDEENKKEEPEYEELVEIIKEYFSYSDSPELNIEEKEKILNRSLESRTALKYAKIIWELIQEGKKEELEKIAQKIYGNVLTDLYNYEIGIQPYSMSQSWAFWDIAKQIYYMKNPGETNRQKYRIANPLNDEEKQIEIQDRHIGWEIFSKMTTGELDKFLSKFQNPIYRKRMVEFMIEKPNKNGTLPSYKLTELGKNIRLGFQMDN